MCNLGTYNVNICRLFFIKKYAAINIATPYGFSHWIGPQLRTLVNGTRPKGG